MRCGAWPWMPRATTCCWEDQGTSIRTVPNQEAGPATSGSPTLSWGQGRGQAVRGHL